jgi:RNA polymerase sigma-70 factor (ECF subfamily)
VNLSGRRLVWTVAMMAMDMASHPEGRTLALEGDRSAGAAWFRTLGDRELDRAYRLAGFILGDGREAEDATQDALARAWGRRASLRDPAAAQAWFDRILVNVCRDRLRGRGPRVRWLTVDDHGGPVPDPFAETIAADGLLQAVGRLGVDHRVVVVLRFWADLPLDGIAERLGIPLGTVKSRLHYALRELRRIVDADEAGR